MARVFVRVCHDVDILCVCYSINDIISFVLNNFATNKHTSERERERETHTFAENKTSESQ